MKSNKLHINMKKCCYMYFNPNKRQATTEDEDMTLHIHNTPIELVSQTKFLGVILDDRLSWTPHIQHLATRLKCHIGSINRIKDNIPSQLHKQLYHTLFESHLTYGITVWGGEPSHKLDPLLNLQKKCIRILFGDKEQYLDKFRTCVRSRPHGSQLLGSKFFAKENSKPLFNDNNILTLYNLYTYHTTMEVFKILKYRTPISLYSLFTRSNRKDTLLITPSSSQHFIFKSSDLWNLVRQKLKLFDLSYTKISSFKSLLKKLITNYQKFGDDTVWNDNELNVKHAFKFNCLPDFQYDTLTE